MSEARRNARPTAITLPKPGVALLHRLLRKLQYGRISITLPDGAVVTHRGQHSGTDAWMELRNWRPLRAFLPGGDTALAASHIAGD
jgi:cyclopropane-fatty-acyl-phospholipid synthase